MFARVADLRAYRKQKSMQRVLEALEQFEQFQKAVLIPLEGHAGKASFSPDELEEFMLQVLGDHLVGRLESVQEIQALDENYRRFDGRLRRCLQTKLKSLARFESI